MNEIHTPPTPQHPDHAIAITAIIATALVLVVCIAGCSVPLIIAALQLH